MSATLAAIGGAAALGSAIYGAVASSQANKKARQLIQQQRDENKKWYDIKMAQDYTQRSDVQAAIKRQRELLEEQYNNARKTAAVAGGTDEAVALQKEAANKSLSDTMTDVAAQASNYKDSVEQQYRAQDAALNQQQAQSYQQQAAATAQAASQAVNAGIGMVGNELHNTSAAPAEDAALNSSYVNTPGSVNVETPDALKAEMKTDLGGLSIGTTTKNSVKRLNR